APEESTMKDRQHLVTADWLAQLIDPVGHHVELLEEHLVAHRLLLAGLERVDQDGVSAVGDLDRQVLEEVLGLAVDRRAVGRGRAGPSPRGFRSVPPGSARHAAAWPGYATCRRRKVSGA